MSLGSPLRLLRAALFAAVCLALSAVGHWWMSGQGIPVHALGIAYVAVFAVALVLTGRERSFSGIAGAVLLSELALHVYFSSAQSATGTTAAAAAWAAVLICVPGQQGGQLPPGMTVESLLRAAGLDPSLVAHAPAAASSMGMAMGSHAMSGMSMAGMSMPQMSVSGSGGGMGTGTGMAMGHGLWGMLAAHVVAGLISAWWLRRGEAAVFAMVGVLAMTAFGIVLRLALVLLAPASGSWAPAAPVRRARDAWLLPQPGRCALLDVVVRRGPPQLALAA